MKKKLKVPWKTSNATPEQLARYQADLMAYNKQQDAIKKRNRFWINVWSVAKWILAAISVAAITVFVQWLAKRYGLEF